MNQIRISTLPNGLRVVTRDMPGLHSAAIGIWVSAGGRDERADQNGIAHFLEHMAFKGTPTRSALQIAEEIENVGGYINAYTSRDVTSYYVRVLAGDVSMALDVISDIVLNPVFDQREIEVERGVILQEIGQSLDTPDDVIFDWLQEAAYPDQPMGRTILGPAERVSHFTREDLSGFIGEHYGPERMIVAASGAVDHDSILRQVEAIFSHLAPRALTAREHIRPGVPMISLSTAHPAKFPDAVEEAVGIRPPLPPHMADLFERDERITRVANDAESIKSLILERRTA